MGIEPDTGLKRVAELPFTTRNGIGRDMRKTANDTTKIGTGQDTERRTMTFVEVAPETEGYYWGQLLKGINVVLEPVYVFENDRLSWGTYWKVQFIGDSHAYSLPAAQHKFGLLFGGKCL